MKAILYFILIAAVLSGEFARGQVPLQIDQEIAFAAKQYEGMLKTHPDRSQFPQSTNPDGSMRNMKSDWWCSGFFGGALWYLYEYTGDDKWKQAAHRWTMAVAKEQDNTSTHDLGFMLYCPFGNGYRLTGKPVYRAVMLKGARSLAKRFNADYGVIKSWDRFTDRSGRVYNYPVIIDNMMNLELLFWAARQSGDKRFSKICISHADNTLKNHFRTDASSYHVICYGQQGTVLAKLTHQGHADESSWARGQAWALYGYTFMYRETKNANYLQQARRIAAYYLGHPNLPVDKIPYWDFSTPKIPNEERDVSAGAIVASAMLELSTYGGPSGRIYWRAAEQILMSLSSPHYKAKLGENNHFILKHSVGNKPANSEIDVPLIYADYYYLEALVRYDWIRKKKGLSF